MSAARQVAHLEADPPRPRMSGGERREQLIGVAKEVFAERGYEATSIEEIAERARVSKPLVYQHFGGKEGLYRVIINQEVRHLLDRITPSLSAEHPRAAVEQAANAFLLYVEEEEAGFRILVRDAPSGVDGGLLRSVLSDIAVSVEGLLGRELRQRGYPRSFAPVLARALVGMVALTGEWWLDAGKPRRSAVVARIVNLAWNGLKDLEKAPVSRTA